MYIMLTGVDTVVGTVDVSSVVGGGGVYKPQPH